MCVTLRQPLRCRLCLRGPRRPLCVLFFSPTPLTLCMTNGRFAAPDPPSKARLPSWSLAASLAAFVAGTYWYAARSSGTADLIAEIEREARRQEADEAR